MVSESKLINASAAADLRLVVAAKSLGDDLTQDEGRLFTWARTCQNSAVVEAQISRRSAKDPSAKNGVLRHHARQVQTQLQVDIALVNDAGGLHLLCIGVWCWCYIIIISAGPSEALVLGHSRCNSSMFRDYYASTCHGGAHVQELQVAKGDQIGASCYY